MPLLTGKGLYELLPEDVKAKLPPKVRRIVLDSGGPQDGVRLYYDTFADSDMAVEILGCAMSADIEIIHAPKAT